jgi:hypothetical protein
MPSAREARVAVGNEVRPLAQESFQALMALGPVRVVAKQPAGTPA